MKSSAQTVEAYLLEVPKERVPAFTRLRTEILENIPQGFEEQMNYGMIGYVVPHSLYPDGYHCDPKMPLPFMNLASQKNFIAFYHAGIYAVPNLADWFTEEYKKRCKYKLDMGKCCVRLKKLDDIPYDLIGELVQKVSVAEWIRIYEKNVKK